MCSTVISIQEDVDFEVMLSLNLEVNARSTRGERARSAAETKEKQGGVLMKRYINVAGAQMGPIARSETRNQVVKRQLELMREA